MQAPPNSRIELIDVLRGFTLLGIAIIHFAEQYYAGPHPQAHMSFNIKFLGDTITIGFIEVLISGKFFMIFSFLFGLSFSIQLNKSEAGGKFLLRFLWRLIILLAIGFVHHLHYRGDILTIYAMLGVGLLLLYKLPDKLLLIVALCLTLNLPSAIVRGVQALQPAPTETQATDAPTPGEDPYEVYYNTVKSGSYLEVMEANFYEFAFKYHFQVDSGRIYITLGLFLLGLYAGRKRFFENLEAYLPLVKKILLKRALWSILGLIVLAATFFGSIHILQLPMPDVLQWAIGGLIMDAFNMALASIYVAGIILLFQKERWRNRLMGFYAAGRMGLTTYLMQTLFGVLIFFGIGLGLLGEIGALLSMTIGIFVFIGQCYFSSWWLSKFRYGPVEWLWRSATYLKNQPFKI